MSIQWVGVFENYARSWVNRHYWRVAHLMDKDDALQECALIFTECLKYYAAKPGMNAAWFMSLYKRAIAGDWHDLASKDTKQRPLMVGMTDSLELLRENTPDASSHILAECWVSASSDLRTVMGALAGASSDMLDMVFSAEEVVLPNTPSEAHLNARLKRFSGVRGSADVVGELRSLLA